MCFKRDAIDCIDLDGDALQLVRLIRGVDDFSETAARKSKRSFISPFLPALFRVRYHCPFVSSPFLWSEFTCMVFCCKFIPLFPLLFCPSDCELSFTINWIFEKSIVNTCEMFTFRVDFLAASLPRIPSQMVLSLYFGFVMPNMMSRSFLYDVVRDRECIQSEFVTEKQHKT